MTYSLIYIVDESYLMQLNGVLADMGDFFLRFQHSRNIQAVDTIHDTVSSNRQESVSVQKCPLRVSVQKCPLRVDTGRLWAASACRQ